MPSPQFVRECNFKIFSRIKKNAQTLKNIDFEATSAQTTPHRNDALKSVTVLYNSSSLFNCNFFIELFMISRQYINFNCKAPTPTRQCYEASYAPLLKHLTKICTKLKMSEPKSLTELLAFALPPTSKQTELF